jgi:hypothetical protein
MNMHRSFMLPLFAAIALSPLAEGTSVAKGKFSANSSFGYVNALPGSNKTDVYMDGKAIFRNMGEGRAKKPKKMSSEGYSVQINAAKVGFNYLDLNIHLIAGREYTLIPMGSLENGTASSLLIDLPMQVIPKHSANVVLANAVADAQPVDLLINGQVVAMDVPAQAFTLPIAVTPGKQSIEVQVDGVTVWQSNKVNLKKGQTNTMVLMGTAAPEDSYGIGMQVVASKGL